MQRRRHQKIVEDGRVTAAPQEMLRAMEARAVVFVAARLSSIQLFNHRGFAAVISWHSHQKHMAICLHILADVRLADAVWVTATCGVCHRDEQLCDCRTQTLATHSRITFVISQGRLSWHPVLRKSSIRLHLQDVTSFQPCH